MSTTISPAFRLSEDADIFAVGNDLREALRPMLVKHFRDIVSDFVFYQFDAEISTETLENPSFKDFYKKTLGEINEALIHGNKPLDPMFLNLAKSIRYYRGVFLRNEERNEKYLMLPLTTLGDKDLLEKTVLSVPGVEEEYSYWDATDSQLEYMTKEEHFDRYKAWRGALDMHGNAFEQGLVVQFFGDVSGWTHLTCWSNYDAVFSEIATEERESHRFRQLVMNYYAGAYKAKFPDTSWHKLFFGMNAFMSSEELNPLLLAFAEEAPELVDEALKLASDRVTDFPIYVPNS